MKKLVTIGLSAILSTSLIFPTMTANANTQGKINSFFEMDFESMMGNTSGDQAQFYKGKLEDKKELINGNYDVKKEGVLNNSNTQKTNASDIKNSLNSQYEENNNFESKFDSIKSKMSSLIDNKVDKEEANYDKKDAANKKLEETVSKANDSKHLSTYNSYKNSATASMNGNYKNYAGKFNSEKSRLSGKYDPKAFALTVSELEGRVQGSGSYKAANDSFNNFSQLSKGLRDKVENGISDYYSKNKDPEEAVDNQVKSLNTKMRASRYDPMIDMTARKYGVDPNLVKAIVQQESGFNPKATSPVGAQGLMQLMPATARGLGIHNSLDPKQNLDGGVRYISSLLKQYKGDTKMALAAYNAGPGNVSKYGGIPPFKETQNYVKKICSNYDC